MKNTLEARVKKNTKIKRGDFVYMGKDGFVHKAKTKEQLLKVTGKVVKLIN